MSSEFLAVATALLVTLGLTPVARRLALRLGVIDEPGPRKVHHAPTPLLGGLGIYAGMVLSVILFMGNNGDAQAFGILAGATLLMVVGFLDDRGVLHHQIKLMLAMPLAALILIVSGMRMPVPFLPLLPLPLEALISLFLTFFWVVGITAAFSILDHLDGLCAGIAAVAAAFFLALAALSGQVLVGIMAAATLGACLGFLRWNFHPSTIFMGDGGAMFLGFLMAALGLKLHLQELSQATMWMLPFLVLGVPIFDTTLVSFSRIRRGLIPFTAPGKDHTAHRLIIVGLGQRSTVLVLYAAGGLLGLLALMASQLSVGPSYILASSVMVTAVLAIVILQRTPYEQQGKLLKIHSGDDHPKSTAAAEASGSSPVVER